MKANRFEEVLEECLSAHLEGRRSVEESLALYPALRPDLEPLLRTAAGVSDRLQSFAPPANVRDRGLQRFLADARARQRVRVLAGGTAKDGWFHRVLGRYSLGLAAGAAALALVAVAVTAAIMNGGESGTPSAVRSTGDSGSEQAPETPVLLTNLQDRIEHIRRDVSSGRPVAPDLIEELTLATQQLRSASPGDLDVARAAVIDALAEAETLVLVVAGSQPEVADQAQAAVVVIRDVAGVIGGSPESPVATPATQETPAAGDPGGTPAPTEPPAETPAPTPEPTDPPAATPAPTDEPQPTQETRGLPGIAP
jgi:hypothetical protein